MSLALEEAQALLPQPIADDCARSIAAAMLKAEVGERDPVRLRTLAMSNQKLEGTNVAEAPPAMPSN